VERIVSHDLKAPLNGLINIPRLLLEDENLQPEQRDMLRLVEVSGRKMLTQINSSLELHRIERGLYVPRAAACDPAGLLRLNASILEISMGFAPGTVVVKDRRAGDGEPERTVFTDEVLLDIVFMNVLRNALEATPPGGTVGVELTAGEGQCVVAVTNALAVPEAVRADFFEKYSTAGKPGGTGLGAYSADVMTRALGGSVTMETSEEAGTRVVVRIPDRR